jgi:hypothetical protein
MPGSGAAVAVKIVETHIERANPSSPEHLVLTKVAQ